MLEVLIGLTILAVAVMTQVSSIFGYHQLARDMRCHSRGADVARRILVEIQSDEDWPGLYDRLANLRLAAAFGGRARLNDGTHTLPATSYAPDLDLPPDMHDVGVVVDTPPRTASTSHAEWWPSLRENRNLPEFGLPADLNADGKITGGSRSNDYVILPVRARVRWTGTSGQTGEVSITSWLRGRR